MTHIRQFLVVFVLLMAGACMSTTATKVTPSTLSGVAVTTATPATTAQPATTQATRVTPTTAAPVIITPATTAPAATTPGHPAGATALCNDGTYSYSAQHSGSCSHHGGVAQFYS